VIGTQRQLSGAQFQGQEKPNMSWIFFFKKIKIKNQPRQIITTDLFLGPLHRIQKIFPFFLLLGKFSHALKGNNEPPASATTPYLWGWRCCLADRNLTIKFHSLNLCFKEYKVYKPAEIHQSLRTVDQAIKQEVKTQSAKAHIECSQND
jgi:hypothetical protein